MYADARAFGTYEELLRDPTVDIVYIALPNHLHGRWTVRCAEYAKHILCEKPLSVDYAEAVTSIDAARERDVFLMEGLMYRIHPQTDRLGQLIRDGAIGRVRVIQAAFGGRVPSDQENIRLRKDAAGGAILDTGSYCISMARFLAGASMGQPFAEPTELKAIGHIGTSSQVDEWSSAVMRFADDSVASVICSNKVDLDWALRIWGTDGHITVPSPWLAGKDRDPGRILLRKGDREETFVLPTELPIYAMEADAVAGSIASRQIDAPGMTWADSLGNIRALDAWRAEIGLRFDSDV
jgi:predicted dehydrogenase